MGVRSFLFEKILHAAHRSMNLGPIFPVTELPKCYDKEHYDPSAIQALKRPYIVVGPSEFTYWADEGDRQVIWESWVVSDVDTFILRYYRPKLYGELAVYSILVTSATYGGVAEHARIGKYREWNEKMDQVKGVLVRRLDAHLDSVPHTVLKQFFSWVG